VSAFWLESSSALPVCETGKSNLLASFAHDYIIPMDLMKKLEDELGNEVDTMINVAQ
jgi:hypothetical protein